MCVNANKVARMRQKLEICVLQCTRPSLLGELEFVIRQRHRFKCAGAQLDSNVLHQRAHDHWNVAGSCTGEHARHAIGDEQVEPQPAAKAAALGFARLNLENSFPVLK